MIQFDEHIFQMGWNHQPEMDVFARKRWQNNWNSDSSEFPAEVWMMNLERNRYFKKQPNGYIIWGVRDGSSIF